MQVQISTIKLSVEHIPENLREYIDYERMDEQITTITFPPSKETNKFIAIFLKYQYDLPVKYLDPIIEQCYYVAQKSPIPNGSKHVTDASITIEPNNQNIFKQISYTPINQNIPEGTIISLHETIPWDSQRKILTSSSLIYNGILCNRCIPYSTMDIGSEIMGKFVVKTNTERKSMALYRFRRPKDNILTIITPLYLGIDSKYIFNLFLKTITNDSTIINMTKEILSHL